MKRERGRLDLRTGLGLLVVLGFVFGAGVLVGSGWQSKAPDAVELELPARPPAPEERAPAVLRPLQSATPLSAQLHALLAELPPLELARGEHRFVIHVQSDDGAPLPGVRVKATPGMPRLRRTSGASDGLEADLVTALERVRWQHAATLEATTDEGGACVIDGALLERHGVTASKPGWSLRAQGFPAHAAEPGGPYVFIGTRLHETPFLVVAADGTPMPSATVRVSGKKGSFTHEWSAEKPAAVLYSGTYVARAEAGAHREWASGEVEVVVADDADPDPVRLVLELKTVVQVKVLPAPAQDFETLRVKLIRVPEGRRADVSLFSEQRDPFGLETTGVPGGARVTRTRSTQPGPHVLGLLPVFGGRLLLWKEVEVVPGFNEIVVDAPPVARRDYALVRVSGPDGTDWDELQWGVSYESGDGGRHASSDSARPARQPDGRYFLFHPEVRGGVDGGTFTITLHHPRLGVQHVVYAADQPAEVEARFSTPVAVDVAVAGVEGSRYAGRLLAQLSAVSRSASTTRTRLQASATLDDRGQTRLQGVQPGRHLLSVYVRCGGGGRATVLEADIDVKDSDTSASLTLPTLYEVEVLGAKGGVEIQSQGGAGTLYVSRTEYPDGDGALRLDAMPAGRYWASTAAGEVEFEVPATKSIRVK